MHFLVPLSFAALTVLLAACQRGPANAPAAVTASAPAALAAPTAPAAVADYLAELAAVEQATAPRSLETLLAKAEAAQNALMEVTGEQAVLERYSEADFATLQTQVRGLKLHRELEIYAQPDPVFFLALAKAHGGPADLAFFEHYAASWGPDLVPTYLKLRPQPTPCVRFGEGRIAPLYAGWQAFVAAYPLAYSEHAAQNLRDLEEAVALGTCACNGLESVRQEQADFLKQFPNAAQADVIKTRREELARDPDKLPVHCR